MRENKMLNRKKMFYLGNLKTMAESEEVQENQKNICFKLSRGIISLIYAKFKEAHVKFPVTRSTRTL